MIAIFQLQFVYRTKILVLNLLYTNFYYIVHNNANRLWEDKLLFLLK